MWSTSTAPTISLITKTLDGSGSGSFSSNLTNLIANTQYYIRAYATNSAGTAYGEEKSFITLANVGSPTLTTGAISSIAATTAQCGGIITADNNGAITARGLVWSTSTAPTISLSTKTADGIGTGTFTSSITGLTPNTKYYVRAYATNSGGTAYGDEKSFSTLANIGLPILSTAAISSIAASTAQSGGNITSDGNGAITARGLVWSTSTAPTISLSTKSTDGTGTGAFTSNLTGLAANTKYYVRAYATNSAGTAYGSEISFTTSVAINLSLDGKWLNSGGTGITITGTTGVYYSFSSSAQAAAAKGLISIGSVYLKNIVQVSTYKWTCLVLGIYSVNSVPTQAIWSTDGTIMISTDGKTCTIDANFIMPNGVHDSTSNLVIRQ